MELPKYFVIQRDANNPLWDEYIKWLNKNYNSDYSGADPNYYYGFDGYLCGDKSDRAAVSRDFSNFKNNPKILTLEQWDEIVNPKKFPLNTFVKNDGDNKVVFDYLIKNGFSNPNYSDGRGILYCYGIDKNSNIRYCNLEEVKSNKSTLISFKEFESTYLNKQEKPKEMKNRTLTPKNAQRIIDIACISWKPNLALKWATNIVLNQDIEISEEFYQEMRKACTKEQNTLFDEIFGKDVEVCPDGTPCLVRDYKGDPWKLLYANGKGGFYIDGKKSGTCYVSSWAFVQKLDINNLPVN